jgi:hypothetical protein
MQKFILKDFVARKNNHQMEFFEKVISAVGIGNGVYLAGGAIRNLLNDVKNDKDYDFFFASSADLTTWETNLLKTGKKVFENTFCNTYKLSVDNQEIKIQAIKHQFYTSLEDLLNSFDYTICMFGYDGSNLICGDYSLWDLSSKSLIVNKITYPVASIRRLIKYSKYGFKVCNGTISTILQNVVNDQKLLNNDIEYLD